MVGPVDAWSKLEGLTARSYTCASCSTDVSSERGWSGKSGQYIFVCPKCNWPTIFIRHDQYPLPHLGGKLGHLPPDVENLWNEIRDAFASGAPALAVMGCRTMLIHVAEDAAKQDGAKDEDGKALRFGRFVAAEKYLEDNHWLPKGAIKLGEKIRKKGDESAHNLGELPDTAEALETVKFTEMVLRYVYEVPAQVNSDRGIADA